MMLDKIALASLIERWGPIEDASTAVVLLGVIGELIAELTPVIRSERSKKRLAVISTLAVIIGIAGELFTQHRLSAYNGELIALVNNDAAKANERAEELTKESAQLSLDLAKEREKTSPRHLTKEQFNAIQRLRGKVQVVGVTWEAATEPSVFAAQILTALQTAGISVNIYPAPLGQVWTGIWVAQKDMSDIKDSPLLTALDNIEPVSISRSDKFFLIPGVPTDLPLIAIGERTLTFAEKYPYFGPYIQRK